MMNTFNHFRPAARRVVLGGVILSTLTGGCRWLRPRAKLPPPVPVFDAHAESFVGSPLSGPTGAPVPPVLPDDVRVVTVTWTVLKSMDWLNGLKPLDAQARLTTSPLAGGAVLPVAEMSRTVRYAGGDDGRAMALAVVDGALGASETVVTQTATLVPGSAVRFSSAFDVSPNAPNLSISLGQTSLGGTLAVTVERLPVEGSTSSTTQQASGAETSLVSPVQVNEGEHFVVALPQSFGVMPWRTLVVDAAVTKPADAAQASADLTRTLSESVARVRADQAMQASGAKPALLSALAALAQTVTPRTPLLFLATTTDAPAASDFVLGADDALVRQLKDQLLEFESKHVDAPSTKRIRWFLERTSIEIMVDQATKNTLAPELATVLAVHFGEVGRSPDTVGELVKLSTGVDDLNQRVLSENYVFLEDNSAASRVRAFDWLKTLGKAPAGYDPLGDARARRDAINKALGPDGGTP